MSVTFDEVRMICRPCQEKLESFYSYYLFVLENQAFYNDKVPGLIGVDDFEDDNKVKVFVEPIIKFDDNVDDDVEERPESNGRKSKRLRGVEPEKIKNEFKDFNRVKSKQEPDWRNFSDDSDDNLPDPKERVKDPQRVRCGKMAFAAKRRKQRLRETMVDETPRSERKPKEPKPKKESQEGKIRLEMEKRDMLIQKYFGNKCDDCDGKEWKSFNELSKHCKKEHGSRKHYICCGVFLSTGISIYQHCLEHENPIQCSVCGMVCVSNAVNKRHLLDVHGIAKKLEEETPYECHLCHRRYKDKDKIRAHMERNHLTTQSETYFCETCARPYKTTNSLRIHIRRDHLGEKLPKSQCPHCGKWILNTGMPFHIRKHMAPPPTEKFKCDKCGSQHTQYHGLLKHQKRHHSELSNRFQCPQCPKGFFTKRHFDEHFAVHTGEILYHCEWCESGFKSMGNYLAHKRKLHPILYAQQKLANQLRREEQSRPN